jgi:serine/threonine-protein kinase
MLGSIIAGRYRVRALLGEGGMGMVYEGVHGELGRPVAIKVLRPAWASDPGAVERFFREARAASGLGHPNICDVYDLGRLDNGRPFMVMPKLEGRDLAGLLEEDGPQSPARVAELLRGPAAALDAIHAMGMVHRDIKPENMFVSRLADGSEVVRVVDFGLATLLVGGDPRLTREGLVCGTPIYIAPEATQGDLPDARGDVYSLAVVAYELIAGVPPLENESPFALLTMKLTQDAPLLSAKATQAISAELDRVLARGLEQQPEYRYRTAGELVRAIANAAAAPASAASPPVGKKHTEQLAWMQLIDEEDGDPGNDAARLAAAARSGMMAVAPRDADDAPPLPRESRPRRVLAAVAAFALALLAGGTWMIASGVLGGAAPPADVAEPAGTTAEEPRPAMEPAASPTPPVARPTAAAEAEGEATPDALPVETAPNIVADRDPPRSTTGSMRRRSGRETPGRPEGAAERASGQAATTENETAVTAPTEPTSRVGQGELPSVPGRDRDRARELEREATSALARGMLPRAIELYRDATLADPGHAPSWRGLGIANERLGRAQDARRAYERYLRLASSAPDADAIRRRLEAL